MKNNLSRWLPAIARENPFTNTDKLPGLARISGRKAVLGIAGLAFIGAGIAGPTTAAFTGPSDPTTTTTTATATTTAMTPAASNAPSVKALNYDYKRQPNFYYCGPAATRIALTALGHTPSFDAVAQKLGTTIDGTNSANDTTRVLNAVTGTTFYKTHEIPKTPTATQIQQLKNDVINAVATDHPVVANIAGTITDNSGDTHSYEGGHYLTIVGYADSGNNIKIADPANPQGDGSYWVHANTMANWIATRGYSA